MPAAVTIPVATRLLSTYACQDMVEDLPDGISAGEGRRSSAGAHDQPPRPRGQLTPGGVGVRSAGRAQVIYRRDVFTAPLVSLAVFSVVKAERTSGQVCLRLGTPFYAHALGASRSCLAATASGTRFRGSSGAAGKS